MKKREIIEIATIERRGRVGGFVSPVPLEEEAFPWRFSQEHEAMTFMASLAGERHFYGGDNSVGVGGDMVSWTSIVSSMISNAAMGETLANPMAPIASRGDKSMTTYDTQIENKLQELYQRTAILIAENELMVMAIAHALEYHHTISGEDIDAIFTATKGPQVDGAWYRTPEFDYLYRRFHAAALAAHQNQTKLDAPFPVPGTVVFINNGLPATAQLGSGLYSSPSTNYGEISSAESNTIDVDPEE